MIQLMEKPNDWQTVGADRRLIDGVKKDRDLLLYEENDDRWKHTLQ